MSQPPLYASTPAPEPAKAASEPALLSCPMDAGAAEVVDSEDRFSVYCKTCSLWTNTYRTQQEAVNAWNRRAYVDLLADLFTACWTARMAFSAIERQRSSLGPMGGDAIRALEEVIARAGRPMPPSESEG